MAKRSKWAEEQEELKLRIITEDDFPWRIPSSFYLHSPFPYKPQIECQNHPCKPSESGKHLLEAENAPLKMHANSDEELQDALGFSRNIVSNSDRNSPSRGASSSETPFGEEKPMADSCHFDPKVSADDDNDYDGGDDGDNEDIDNEADVKSSGCEARVQWANREPILIELNSEASKPELKYIGGVDLSYVKEDSKVACAALMVTSLPDLKVCYEAIEICHVDEPYIPGFLAFREFPIIQKLVQKVKVERPEFLPQIILVDGNGILHPRGCGLACHLGIHTNIPTIGVGKSMHHVDGLQSEIVKSVFKEKKVKCGQYYPLIGKSGRLWGAALRSSEESFNPIFLSVGYKISLKSAVMVVLNCCRFRIPEPLRLADIRSREVLRLHGY